jgi:hypothetical protein
MFEQFSILRDLEQNFYILCLSLQIDIVGWKVGLIRMRAIRSMTCGAGEPLNHAAHLPLFWMMYTVYLSK